MLALLFAAQGTLVFLVSVFSIKHLFGILLLVSFAVLTLFSTKRLLLALIFLIIVMPIIYYRSPLIPFAITYELVGLLFAILLFYFLIQLLSRGTRCAKCCLGLPLSVFLLWCAGSALVGFTKGHRLFLIFYEIFFLFLYVTYWIVIETARDERFIRSLFLIIVVGTVLVSMEYLYVAVGSRGLSFLMSGRIATRQANMALVALPYLVTGLFFSLPRRKKIASLLAVFLILPMVLLSQQRALWAGLAMSLFVVCVLTWKKTRLSLKQSLVGLMVLVLVFIILSQGLMILQRVTGLNITGILQKRLLSFLNVTQDPAILVRFQDYTAVLEKTKDHPVLGCGLGDSFLQLSTRRSAPFVDNSFLTILWKTGIVGLCAYLWLIVSFFRRASYVIRKTAEEGTLTIAISTTASFTGLLFVALSAATLLGYRLIIVWATLLGIIEVLALRTRKAEIT
ncbi:MAG: O-antigen ligase family protein [bacterium]